MLIVEGRQLEMNSIIELCVPPTMKVHNMMVGISKQVENPIFLDTVGNLKFCTEAFYILGYRRFVRKLLSFRSKKGFVLFIDSISFLEDKAVGSIWKVSSILRGLVNNNDATVIVSSHYKIMYSSGVAKLVPRFDYKWGVANYRITFKCK